MFNYRDKTGSVGCNRAPPYKQAHSHYRLLSPRNFNNTVSQTLENLHAYNFLLPILTCFFQTLLHHRTIVSHSCNAATLSLH